MTERWSCHVSRHDVFAALIVIVVTSAMVDAATVACVLYPNSPTDLGFAYNFFLAARSVRNELVEASSVGSPISLYNIDSVFSTLSSPSPSTALAALINRTIALRSCTIVISTSMLISFVVDPTYLFTVPRFHPSVRFVEYNPPIAYRDTMLSPQAAANLPPNVQGFTLGISAGWFAAGAAAVVQCSRCIGFISPDASHVEAARAFARGMRWAASDAGGFVNASYRYRNSTPCPLYNIVQNSFFDPVAEETITRLFLNLKGCDIIAAWTDDQTASSVVKSLSTHQRRLFSISYNVDASRFLGDSVLTSVLLTPEPILQSLLNQSSTTGLILDGTNSTKLSSFSPLAKRLAVAAGQTAYENQQRQFSVNCGGLQTTNGTWVYQGCATDAQLQLLYSNDLDILAVSMPEFQRGTQCALGTEPVYEPELFSMSCVRCAAGKVSPGGGAACSACPVGFIPDADGSTCTADRGSTASSIVIIVATTISVGGAIGIAVVVGVIAVRRRWQQQEAEELSGRSSLLSYQNRRKPPSTVGSAVGIILIGADTARSAKGWRSDETFAYKVVTDISLAVATAAHAHGGFVAQSVGDVHLVSTDCLKDALALADNVVQMYRRQSSVAAHVSLRVIVTVGQVLERDITLETDAGGLELTPAHHDVVHRVTLAPLGSPPQTVRNATSVPATTPQDVPLWRQRVVYRGPPIRALLTAFDAGGVPAWSLLRGASLLIVDPAMGSFPSTTRPGEEWAAIDRPFQKLLQVAVLSLGMLTDASQWCSSGIEVEQRRDAARVAVAVDARLRSNRAEVLPIVGWLVTDCRGSHRMPEGLDWEARPECDHAKPEASGPQPRRSGAKGTFHFFPSHDTGKGNNSPPVDAIRTQAQNLELRFSLLQVDDVDLAARYAFVLISSALRRLEDDERRRFVRLACERLHITLEPRLARRVVRNGDGRPVRVVFAEADMLAQISLEVLSSMDEQLLRDFLVDCGDLRRASREASADLRQSCGDARRRVTVASWLLVPRVTATAPFRECES